MTMCELNRAISSKQRVLRTEARQKANFDYILADLIGRSIGRIYSSSATIPDITIAYPTLFSDEELEEQRAKKQAELSALRFRQFADSFNRRFKKEGESN